MRLEYREEVREIDPKNLIFIDESAVNLALTRTHARAEQGQRAHGDTPSQRGQSVSIVGALGLSKVLSVCSILGAYNSLSFEAFIVTRVVPKLWEGACVVIDNCSIHKGEGIKEAIEEAGGRLIYLPPYSPDFSPIENLWSKVKNEIKKLEARTYIQLGAAIEEAFGKVTEKDIHNWFTHGCYCTSPF